MIRPSSSRLTFTLGAPLPPDIYTVEGSVMAKDRHRREGSFSFTLSSP